MSTPAPNRQSAGLEGQGIRVRYDPQRPVVLHETSLVIPEGKITGLIGPNGSGKSTLLKTLARQLQPEAGRVLLAGDDIQRLSARALAQKLGILFQDHHAPDDLAVEQLVYHGRYPYGSLLHELTPADDAAVEEALRRTGLQELRTRSLAELSGGQRQLAWIAMALAQEPHYLFLDEPTTFLDLAHQLDVMQLLTRLNAELHKTVVLVVHDLNLIAREAHHLFALRDGRILAQGPPDEVLTPETLRAVFEVEMRIIRDEDGQILFCLPERRARAGPTEST